MDWRRFADTVAVILGLNVWIAVVVLPGFSVDAWTRAAPILLGLAPMPVLLFGIWRRSESMLLLGFPAALLIPIAVHPEMTSPRIYTLTHFTVVAVGVVAYLLSASMFTTAFAPKAEARLIALDLAPESEPSSRHTRILAVWALLGTVLPLVLIYTVNFDANVAEFVERMYRGRQQSFTVIMNLLITTLWLALFSNIFVAVLENHRTGDRVLARRSAAMRSAPRKPTATLLMAGLALATSIAAMLVYRGR